MTNLFKVFFTNDSFQILEQPSHPNMVFAEPCGILSVGAVSYPDYDSDTETIFLRGDCRSENNKIITVPSQLIPEIVRSLTIFSARYEWNFQHNYNLERVIL